MIIFSLIKTNFLRNNRLFKRNSTPSKGNRIIKMGRLFFTSSLNAEKIFINVKINQHYEKYIIPHWGWFDWRLDGGGRYEID